jgi:diacylglycerol kinase (ATP)
MNPDKRMTFRSRKSSFGYAIQGLRQLFIEEPNAKIHFVATLIAIALGIFKHLSPERWAALVFAIGLVWITEAINTCIEKLCDYACNKEWHPTIKTVKDVAAAAVLIAAIVSATVGAIVFLW